MKNLTVIQHSFWSSILLIGAGATLWSGGGRLHAEAPPALATIRWTGTDFEGRKSYTLEWDAASNTLYRLQRRSGFESNSAWETFDIAVPTSDRGVFKVTPEKMEAGAESIRREFYRVLAPQPEIFSVQPTFVSGSGEFIYIIGQCFPTNVLVYIGGVLQTNVIRLSSGELQVQVTFDPPPSGQIAPPQNVQVRAVELGVERVLAEFDGGVVLGSGSPVSQRLLEVPEEPPGAPVTAPIIAPAAMKAKEKANRTKCASNLRVVPGTGELQLEETDLVVPGRGLDFIWTRTYRSRTGTNTVMGQGWSHSYDLQALVGSNSVTVLDGTGRRDTYYLQTNGVYTADELFNEGALSNGIFTLTFPDTGKWEFNSISNAIAPGRISRSADRNGNALAFGYDVSSRLTEVVDTLGRTNRLLYDGTGRVLSVTDFSGRACVYSYWRTGEAGGGNGDLRTVRSPLVFGTPNTNDFPNGKITTYTYSKDFADNRLNHNLLTITDPAGQTWLQAAYFSSNVNDVHFDRVVSCMRGGDVPTRFSYVQLVPAASNGWAVVQTICNDPEGNVTIDWLDSLNRGVVHRDLAARATAGEVITETNLPTKKLRITDPDFWETRFEWNADSLCTRVIYPRGNSTEGVYQRAYNQNSARSNHARHHDGDLRVLRELACCEGGDLDGDGLPLALTTRFDYDARFSHPKNALLYEAYVKGMLGSSKTAKIPTFNRGYSTGKFGSGPRQTTSMDGSRKFNRKAEESYQPWDSSDDDAGVVSNPLYEGGGLEGASALYSEPHFITKMTDARGGVNTFDYDGQGDCLGLHHQGVLSDGSDHAVMTCEYNTHGQLTAITHPADASGYTRRDEITYYDSGAQNGYRQSFTVDAQGPTVRITSYDYDAVGNTTQVVDPRGNTNRWVYNALNQVVQSIAPPVCNPCAGYLTEFHYDSNDNLVRVERDDRDMTGASNTNKPTWTTLCTYDLLNRCTLLAHELTHVVQQQGGHRFATNRLVYDGNDQVIEAHSPEAVNGNQPANMVSYEYDTRNFLWKQTAGPFTALASTDEFTYDPNGRRIILTLTQQDPTPAIYQWSYDGFDRCVRLTDAMGNVTSLGYDGNGNLIYQRCDGETNDVPGGAVNRRLAETHYNYDSLNRRTATHVSFFDVFTELPLLDGDATTTFSYAPNGACRSVTDDNGHVTHHTYDTSGRLSSTSDPKTNLVNYVYDANDNVVMTIQSDSPDLTPGKQTFLMSYQYDALNRRAADYDNLGNTNSYAYDSMNNCVLQTDPRGNGTVMTYDGLGQRVKSDCCQAGAGYNNLFVYNRQYNDNSQPISFTDGNSNVTRYAYDALNRLVATTNADATVESLIWSPRSNLSSRTDPNGTVITFTYDANSRCVRKDVAPGAGVVSATTFETFQYDGMSRCVMASNDVSMLDFSYDSMGNLRKGKQDCIATALAYDGVGNRISMTYPSGRTVTYGYDTSDQVTNVSTSAGGGLPSVNLAAFAYEGPGRPGRMSRNNNINTRWTWNGFQNSPNGAGDLGWQQVSMVNHQFAGGGTTIDRRISVYDPNQNKILRQQTLPFATGVPALTTNIMIYDALNRMSSFSRNRASSAYTKSLALDAQGNRQSVSSNGFVGLYTMDASTPEPADFQMNQYTGTPFGTEHHDRNGNLVSIDDAAGFIYLAYDYANRLVSVQRAVGPALLPVADFTYDALGRRISKTTYPPAPSLPLTTRYILDPDTDDDGVLEQHVNGTPAVFAVWPHMHKMGGHARISPGGEVLWVHTDELGSALALTDTGGNVLERYDYDEFGWPRFLSADGVPMVNSDGSPTTSSPLGNDYLFRGARWDGETGLYLSKEFSPAEEQLKGNPRHRPAYLNPKTGRYCDQAKNSALCRGGSASTFANDNPWTGGAAGIAIDESGVHVADVLFNPKEYTISREKLKGTTKTQGDFNLAHRFSIEIDGVVVGGRRTVSGLESETEVVAYKDGEDRTTHTRPGNHKPGKMVVTKDWSNTSEWYKWRQGGAGSFGGSTWGEGAGAMMKNGTVKFFNESKGFGMMSSGNGGGVIHWHLEVRFERIEMK